MKEVGGKAGCRANSAVKCGLVLAIVDFEVLFYLSRIFHRPIAISSSIKSHPHRSNRAIMLPVH